MPARSLEATPPSSGTSWHVSAHFVNDTVEFHAVRGTNPPVAHVARCDDGDNPQHQFRAAKLLAEAVGLSDIVGADG
jgi:hypothetical protein